MHFVFVFGDVTYSIGKRTCLDLHRSPVPGSNLGQSVREKKTYFALDLFRSGEDVLIILYIYFLNFTFYCFRSFHPVTLHLMYCAMFGKMILNCRIRSPWDWSPAACWMTPCVNLSSKYLRGCFPISICNRPSYHSSYLKKCVIHFNIHGIVYQYCTICFLTTVTGSAS